MSGKTEEPLFLRQNPGARNFVLLGEAGGGKSELAINLARALAEWGERPVHLYDLDMTKPLFRTRDQAAFLASKGKIVGVGLFNTTLISLDGLYVSAPNSTLWGSPIINYSRNPTRRLDLSFGIDYADSAEKAMNEMKLLVDNDPDVLKNPAPAFFVSALEDSSVAVNLRIWVNTSKYWDMRCKYMKQVKERFDEVGISIPFPQRVVHIVKEG